MLDFFVCCLGFYYYDLLGYFGCVNVIEFFSNGGEFIVLGVYFILFVVVVDVVFCFGFYMIEKEVLYLLGFFVSLGELCFFFCEIF